MTRIGIIGAGQLGQMLGYAGRALGMECLFLDPAADPPAARVGEVLQAPYDSAKALAELAGRSDVITYEFENVPVDAVRRLTADCPVYPPPAALESAQDRVREKRLFEALGIPVAPWRPVSSPGELEAALAELGTPLVVKTRRLGYDGKGQAVLRDRGEAKKAWEQLGGQPSIAEKWLRFRRELSVIGVRGAGGETAFWPLTENLHENGILRISRAPAGDEASRLNAERYLEALLRELDYRGVLALELFDLDGQLLANEFAPRVHNTGHWTIEGARTSQFENHLRAIAGLPIGDTGCTGHAGMVNLIGRMPERLDEFSAAGFFVHDYGKVPREGRKLGHVTVVTADAVSRERRLDDILYMLDQ